MEILICYDVNTETPEGQRRLRRVAKACEDYGQRVQKSVFECSLTATHLERLRAKLMEVIDRERDSLRIYKLREPREDFIEVIGRDEYIDFHGTLLV